MNKESDLPGSQWLDQILEALEGETFDEQTARDIHSILS